MSDSNGWFQLESQAPLKNKPPNLRPRAETAKDAARAENRSSTGGVGAARTIASGAAASGAAAPSDGPAAPDDSLRPSLGAASPAPPAAPPAVYHSAAPPEDRPWKSAAKASAAQASPWAGDVPAELYSQTVGPRGPVLEQDTVLHETLETFVHEKIIERPVHVKGFGAFGYFQTLHSMTPYTKLCFLQQPGQQVPVAVRFSLAVSTKGTPDTSRNVRGFATKFYTDEGVFDLICNHLPVFSVRDAIRFPESIKAFLPSPASNLLDPGRFWAFVARAPESLPFVVRLYSDEGTVKSLRRIPGHSVNTYVWRNEQGVRRYLKYSWKPVAGEQYIDAAEAARLAGENPDIAGQDLHDAIASGTPVEYILYVQLMDPADEDMLPYDPLDDTKVWDPRQYPLLPVGKLVLDRNPDNYMEQVEKLAFSPTNLLDGAELSDDKMLQGRANVYFDSQRRRIGPDFRSVPVNRQADWTPADLVTSGDGRRVEGRLTRSDIPKQDDFAQAGEYYRSLSETGQGISPTTSPATSLRCRARRRASCSATCMKLRPSWRIAWRGPSISGCRSWRAQKSRPAGAAFFAFALLLRVASALFFQPSAVHPIGFLPPELSGLFAAIAAGAMNLAFGKSSGMLFDPS